MSLALENLSAFVSFCKCLDIQQSEIFEVPLKLIHSSLNGRGMIYLKVSSVLRTWCFQNTFLASCQLDGTSAVGKISAVGNPGATEITSRGSSGERIKTFTFCSSFEWLSSCTDLLIILDIKSLVLLEIN